MKVSRFVVIVPAAAALLAAMLGACSSSSDSGTSATSSDAGDTSEAANPEVCLPYSVPPNTDLTTPVSFHTDVMRIFRITCALDGCHGYPSDSQHLNLYLGVANDGGGDLPADAAAPSDGGIVPGTEAAILAQLVNVPSVENPTIVRVTPGDPGRSWLMHKVDGDQCLYSTQCVSSDCGDPMPDKAKELPEDARLTIRRWIAQGAQLN